MRRGFAAWNAGDIDAAFELMHPEIKWRSWGVFPDVDDVYSGREGVRRFRSHFRGPWESIELDARELSEVGEYVLANILFRARGRDGIAVERELGQLYRVRDGLVVEARSYATPADSRAAAARPA